MCYHNTKGRELAAMVGVDIDAIGHYGSNAPNAEGYSVYNFETFRYDKRTPWANDDQRDVVLWAAGNPFSDGTDWDGNPAPIDVALEARVRAIHAELQAMAPKPFHPVLAA